MARITEEELMQDLDFTCARCQAECTKINALEPDLGYISKVDGTVVSPICQNCFDQIPKEERHVSKFPETAFLVVIRPDGEGAYMTTDGVGIQYKREPTFNDIIDACSRVEKDVAEALFTQKFMGQFMRVLATTQKQNKLFVPR